MKLLPTVFGVLFSAFAGYHLKTVLDVHDFLDCGVGSEESTTILLGKDSKMSLSKRKTFSVEPTEKEPVYWLADDEDDFYERTYGDTSVLTHLRTDLNLNHYFPKQCGLYRFNNTALPATSVIMTMRNEAPGLVSLTTHAILARTPPELLIEIIIVDDSDDKDTEEMRALKRSSDKVVHIPTKAREGCARSRLIGARVAKGEVLMFVDSHVEMLSSTWYQHLILPIVENPHTITSQQLQQMGETGNHSYADKLSRGSHFGVVTDRFFFGYESFRFKDKPYKVAPSAFEPYEMPFAPGALFAVRKDEFWRLGGYDEGLYVWGAENLELSIKIWACGGRLVQVPCSNTGHVYRVKDAHKWTKDNFTTIEGKLGINYPGDYVAYGQKQNAAMTRIWLRNNIRIAKLWLGEWKNFYYKEVFGAEQLPPEWAQFEKEDAYMKEQIRIRDKNQCRDYTWFDKNVYMKILGHHSPWWNTSSPFFNSIGR